MVYWGLDFPRAALPGRSLLVFDDGNWHEQLTMDWLRKSAYQVNSEQMDFQLSGSKYGHNGIILTGHIDFVVTDMQGKDYLIEHKAINHFTWGKYADGELPLDYLHQVAIYFAGMQTISPALTDGVLLVKNKNTAQYLEWTLTYDSKTDTLTVKELTLSTGENKTINTEFKDIVKSAFEKFAKVNQLIKDKELPPRQYDMDHWRCQYCQWAGKCYENYSAEFQAMETDKEFSDDIATEMAFCNQLAAQVNSDSAELKERKEGIKKRLKEIGVRQGKTSPSDDGTFYTAELVLMHRSEYVVKASDYEQLNIRRVKPKEGK